MKRTDIAMIVLIAGFAIVIASILTGVLFGDPSDEYVTLDYMEVITSDIAEPDAELFNPTAINPTVETYVGQCKEDETWNSVEGVCMKEEEAKTETEGEGEESDAESENGASDESTDEQNAPEE